MHMKILCERLIPPILFVVVSYCSHKDLKMYDEKLSLRKLTGVIDTKINVKVTKH